MSISCATLLHAIFVLLISMTKGQHHHVIKSVIIVFFLCMVMANQVADHAECGLQLPQTPTLLRPGENHVDGKPDAPCWKCSHCMFLVKQILQSLFNRQNTFCCKNDKFLLLTVGMGCCSTWWCMSCCCQWLSTLSSFLMAPGSL